jgi:uncharacterized protein (TIGR02757 family)
MHPNPGTLHHTLEHLYQSFQHDYLNMDPLEIVRHYTDPADQEIAGFIAAALAIGRYESIRKIVQAILDIMHPAPSIYIKQFDAHRDASIFQDLVYRFYRGEDIGLLVSWIAQMVQQSGSIRFFFLNTYSSSEPDIGPSLSRFVQAIFKLETMPFMPSVPVRGKGIRHFLADPTDGSACKRLNLFLRWMVRHDDLDLGLWPEVSTAQLVIPLDTHIARFGQYLGFTRQRSPGWRMAIEITESLRQFDPLDPVKYDFALCTLGKMGDCSNRPDRLKKCHICPIFQFCGVVQKDNE